ncbi:MAG: sulfite exporter TauE/SafE family protein [Planctomycetota bacterium]
MPLELLDIILLLVIGVVAGTLGGMLGIGGSIIMFPAMAVLFDGRAWQNQHLLQAAAMVVNIAVAVPATLRHRKAGNVRMDLFRIMLPAATVAIIGGVLVSNLFSGLALRQVFAGFLAYVVINNVIKLVRRTPEHGADAARVTPVTGGIVGGAMGFAAGLLGIGGGGIAVPLANLLCRVPLKQAIGASASVMCRTAGVGAILKLATLQQHETTRTAALTIALILIPTALLGGHLGAGLTQAMPIRLVRAVLTVVLAVAALRMGGVL